MDVITFLILTVAIINAFLGALIIFRKERRKSNLWFGFFVLSIIAWCLTMALYRYAKTVEGSVFWVVALYESAIFIPVTLLFFGLFFPDEKGAIKRGLLYLLWIPPLAVVFLTLIPNFIISGVIIPQTGEKIIIWGPYYSVYNIYFIAYFSVFFIHFFLKLKKSTGILKTQVKFILFGTLIPGILANTSNLLLPTFGIFYFNWLGQLSAIIMVLFIVYAILKHHLLNTKVIATEIFAIVIPLALLIDVLLSKTPLEAVLKGGIFVFSAIFSVLLIRSVLKEVRTRERLSVITENLKVANQKLQELDKAKSEFISIASHQLRTPLSSIRGFLSMILEGDYGEISEVVRDKIEKTLQNNERLIRLVDDLLSVSRMEEGRMKYVWTEIDFAEMVKSVFEELKMHGEKKGVAMRLDIPEGKIFIKADETKLRQVVLNLIDNSIKYTEHGSIAVSLKVEKGQALFKVKDTGIGIPKEDTLHLFQKFARGESSPRLWTEGLGLGLYVALMIVEEHEGRIGAESEGEGKGSEFWVRVPIITRNTETRITNSE